MTLKVQFWHFLINHNSLTDFSGPNPPSLKFHNRTDISAYLVNFRYCEKATKFEKIFHPILKSQNNVGEYFQIFVAFSQYSNFKVSTYLKTAMPPIVAPTVLTATSRGVIVFSTTFSKSR